MSAPISVPSRPLDQAGSLLFVPGDRPDRFANAAASGAHGVILDLEDAVAPDAKTRARDAVREGLQTGVVGLVRINDRHTAWYDDDVALCRSPGVSAIMLPKAETPETIGALHRATGKPILALIETARGMDAAKAIAATPGVVRLAFGAIDFSLDLGLDGPDAQLDGFRLSLTLASRLADLPPPIDGVAADFRAADALAATISRVRGLGMGGKLCIHPVQVEAVNRGFAPQPEEVEWARRVAAAGEGAVALDGQMIDRPVRERALRILDRAGAPLSD